MPTALVTGATGMLGSYIATQLARDGWHVRGLVRDAANARWLDALGVTCIRGDIIETSSLGPAISGCDAVFHAAATVGPGGAIDSYHQANVVGTGNVIDAAAAAGARLVHISSTAVYSRVTRLGHSPVVESVPLGGFRRDDVYGLTKLEAETRVLEASERGRLWASVVRPPPLYGERDRQLVPRFAPVLSFGVFPLIGDGHAIMTAAHAGSVAEGAVLAATTEAARGRVYNLTNDFDVTVADFARLAGEGLGRRVRTPSIPPLVGRAAMKVLAAAFIVSGNGALAPHTQSLFDILTRDNPFSSERARTELGWSPSVTPDVAIPAAFRWWKEHRRAG